MQGEDFNVTNTMNDTQPEKISIRTSNTKKWAVKYYFQAELLNQKYCEIVTRLVVYVYVNVTADK